MGTNLNLEIFFLFSLLTGVGSSIIMTIQKEKKGEKKIEFKRLKRINGGQLIQTDMPLQIAITGGRYFSCNICSERTEKRGGISAEPHDSKSMDPDQILL
jgi:hypothetical protein